MKSIILVGYMCVGKTTVGRALAKKLGCKFYDLDWYIEKRYHLKVSEIFAQRGEDGFRDLERRMLHEVAEFEDIILACGGGTPCFFDNMEYMNHTGHVFYMKADTETVLQHLSISKGDRPLLKNKSAEELREFVSEQLEKREPFYRQAGHIIDVNVLDSFEKVECVVQDIINELNTITRTNHAG